MATLHQDLLTQARSLAIFEKGSRTDVLSVVSDLEDVFLKWKNTRSSDNAKVFLADLLLRKSWSRQ
jgi:hypothetical protein